VEELIKAVADSGAKVIVSGAAVGDMALHFCERYKSVFLLYEFLSFDFSAG
jgi:T-complex protein 1 subunit theta